MKSTETYANWVQWIMVEKPTNTDPRYGTTSFAITYLKDRKIAEVILDGV